MRAPVDKMFIGVDGEGYTDKFGKHHYISLTVGDRTLERGGKPLHLEELCSFLLEHSEYWRTRTKSPRYVSYYFDYDVTMILRDFAVAQPPEAAKLFDEEFQADRGKKPYHYVVYNGYKFGYRPHRNFTVVRWTETVAERAPRISIHDMQGFFQQSFTSALETYGIGTKAERRRVAAMKAKRGEFRPSQMKQIVKYSELECELLAQLAEMLDQISTDVGLPAWPYEGPGYLAAAALRKYWGKKEHLTSINKINQNVKRLAQKTYYGGRFEVMAHGPVGRKVYEYDINSAYPAAIKDLPCLRHGKFVRGIKSDLYMAKTRFSLRPQYRGENMWGLAMPLPWRNASGRIWFPTAGEGWYMSPEIEAAKKLCYVEVMADDSWSFVPGCDHQPFAWIEDLYRDRKMLEREAKNSGLPLKLALNSIYGKFAQTKYGEGPWYNPFYASLVTSLVRRQIYDIYLAGIPVVMFATDAVFTLKKLPQKLLGDGLGDWKPAGSYDNFTIFQPGVYFDSGRAKFRTRGIPRRDFAAQASRFAEASLDWEKTVPLITENHLSLRLGLHLGEDWTDRIGNWITGTRLYTGNPCMKRRADENGPSHFYLKKNLGASWSCPRTENEHMKDIKTTPWSTKLMRRVEQEEDNQRQEMEREAIYEGNL